MARVGSRLTSTLRDAAARLEELQRAVCGLGLGDSHVVPLEVCGGSLPLLRQQERFLRLDIDGCLKLLDEIFPVTPDPTLGLNFGEPAGPRDVGTYEAEHANLFQPIRRMFDQAREISGIIQHEVGAFG